MRTTLLGTLLLFSTLAPCRGYEASSVPACVSDCQKILAEHGLLTDDMKSTCATPNLQRAHFQCLINLCRPESYGRALAYSVSTCSDTGVNIIPLHPIEVRQPPKHKRNMQDEISDKIQEMNTLMTLSQAFDLARSFAFALTCNTGQDGVVTVSLGQPQPSTTAPPIAHNKDVLSDNEFMTTVLGFPAPTHSADNAVLMDGSRSVAGDPSTDCESSTGVQRTSPRSENFSTTFTTQVKSTPCSSNESQFGGSTPTSTAMGTKTQGAFTTSGSHFSAPCTTSDASRFDGSLGSSYMKSGTVSNSRPSDPSTSSCTSSTSRTDGSSDNWRPEEPSGQSTSCSSGGGRSSTPTRLGSSTQQTWTSDLQSWSTSRLSGSDAPCSSDSTRSNGITSHTSTAASSTSRLNSLSTSCTGSSRGSNASPASADSASCSSSSGTGMSRGQFEPTPTSNTLSVTSSSTFTTPSSSEGSFSNPAAYTFASASIPPAYVPPLAEYGYGNPPSVYDFPSQGNIGTSSRFSSSSYPISLPTQQSSSGSGVQNGYPSVYGANTATLTQMAHVASTHTILEGENGDTLQDNDNPAKVTLISSVEGGAMQTTIITVNQAQATSLGIPSALVLNTPSNKQNSTTEANKNSESGVQSPVLGDTNDTNMSFETPMPAIVSGGLMIGVPSIYVLISTVVAVGFTICIL